MHRETSKSTFSTPNLRVNIIHYIPNIARRKLSAQHLQSNIVRELYIFSMVLCFPSYVRNIYTQLASAGNINTYFHAIYSEFIGMQKHSLFRSRRIQLFKPKQPSHASRAL